MVGTQLQVSHIDLNIVLQEVLSKLAHFFRPGGTPHQSLAVRLRKRENRSVYSTRFQTGKQRRLSF